MLIHRLAVNSKRNYLMQPPLLQTTSPFWCCVEAQILLALLGVILSHAFIKAWVRTDLLDFSVQAMIEKGVCNKSTKI